MRSRRAVTDPCVAGAPGCELAGALPPEPRVALVGSRACLRALAAAVAPMVEAARDLGWSLVSGGALGIDGAAHRAALEAGVDQLVVAPCGADRPYPPAHADLFARIASTPGSGILFAQPRGRIPTRGMFASRNRIVVALCRSLVVVQAEARSGSLGTGRMALARGLPTAVLLGSPGCAQLRAAGAAPLPWEDGATALREATRAWLAAAEAGSAESRPARDWPLELRWLQTRLAAAGPHGCSVDELPAPLAGIMALTQAEALGLVVEVAPGRFVEA